MTSYERVIAALEHREPDRVPLDIGGAEVAGVNIKTMQNLRAYLGLQGEAELDNKVIQTAITGDDLIERLGIDVKIIPPNPPSNSGLAKDIGLEDGYYRLIDEFGIGWKMPEHGGHYYDLYLYPLAGPPGSGAVQRHEGARGPGCPRGEKSNHYRPHEFRDVGTRDMDVRL